MTARWRACPPHAALHPLGERLSPLFTVRDLSQRFALLVALAKLFNRIAKWDNRKNIDLIGNTQQGLYLLETVVSNPIGADTMSPGSEDHILDSPTRIRIPKPTALL